MHHKVAIAVNAEIGKTLPRIVKVVETQNGKVPVDVLLGLGAKAESDLANRPSHHDLEEEHDHEDFDTFIVDLPAFASPQVVVDRIAKATAEHDILRMKGFVDIKGKPMRLLVQGVGARIQHQFDKRWADGLLSRSDCRNASGHTGSIAAHSRHAIERRCRARPTAD